MIAVERSEREDAWDAAAWLGGQYATDLQERSDHLGALDSGGRWAVCVDFEGNATLARFGHWRRAEPSDLPGRWRGPDPEDWRSSLDARAYREAVAGIRSAISRGDVYQANLCRVLSARLPDPTAASPLALAGLLAVGNPAPYAGALKLPATETEPAVAIACASPELFLSRHGDRLLSRPIKGTAATSGGFLEKDTAENIMIVDLVRNDLGIVAVPGSVEVPEFLVAEQHPGLVHLVSGVSARLRPGITWPEIFAATFPPGSVTGAPKSSALRIIDELEPVRRGPYCGAFGWVDADTGEAELAVAIRTFWLEDDPGQDRSGEVRGAPDRARGPVVCFGSGAGITWGSDPDLEWRETELKASRLIALACGTTRGDT